MNINLGQSAELFLDALNKYKVWISVNKDFVNHADKFEAWDEAICVYAKAIGVSRSYAATEVFVACEVKA